MTKSGRLTRNQGRRKPNPTPYWTPHSDPFIFLSFLEEMAELRDLGTRDLVFEVKILANHSVPAVATTHYEWMRTTV